MDTQLYREAMARLGASVNIITTGGAAGRHGFTASAVCSVTDAPATLLVCMNRGVSSMESFAGNGVLGVNVLTGVHRELSGVFASRSYTMEQRFAAGSWQTRVTGSPLLEGASAAFDCTIAEWKDVGTHRVMFCTVLDVVLGADPQALIYFQRAYHCLPA
jgi:flavin reductase